MSPSLLYCQFSACGHPAFADTLILRTGAKSPSRNYKEKCATNSRYYGHPLKRNCGHFVWSQSTFFLFYSCYNRLDIVDVFFCLSLWSTDRNDERQNKITMSFNVSKCSLVVDFVSSMFLPRRASSSRLLHP